jgi:hypothetical protein
MAIEAYELYNSRRVNIGFDQQNAVLSFFCRGTTDDALARAAILSITPLVFFGLLFQDMDVNPLGGGCWTAEAKYDSAVPTENPGMGGASPPPPPPAAPGGTDALGAGFAFDISVVTENVKIAKALVTSAGRFGNVPPDTKNLIGVTADGEVTGCDRYTPKFEWSVTRKFGFVTLNYYKTLMGLVGTTNDNTWYGFSRGENLCIGASGNGKDAANVEVTMKFAAQPNQGVVAGEDPIEICPGLVIQSKRGWEYLDVHYLQQPDASVLTMQPEFAYVWRIYEESNFALFGIGS